MLGSIISNRFIYTKWIFNTENPVYLSDETVKSPVAVEHKIVYLSPIQEPQSFSDTADGTPSTKVPGTVYTWQTGICKATECVSCWYQTNA